MRICLQFFHTDTVEECSWSNSLITMHVLKAAMFFLVEPLQILALAHLRTVRLVSIEAAEWWASLVTSYNVGVELISSHASHEENYKCRLYRFLCDFHIYASKHLAGCSDVKLFSGSDHERCFYKDVTEPALFHFIQGVRVHDDCKYDHGLAQYFSFLHVVRWNAYRVVVREPLVDEGELEEALSKCFPRSSQMMKALLSSAADIPFDDSDISSCMKRLAGPLADCLERAPVDFAQMPSQILSRLIEPLGIVSPSTLLEAYRLHAVHRPHLQWDELAHGTHYKLIKAKPTFISCSGSRLKGFARCNTSLDATTNWFFDWKIIIRKPCDELRIGFCACTPTSKVSEFNSHVLGDRVSSWALGDDGYLHESGEKSSAPYVSAFVKEGVVVGVHLDMVNSSCSFSINNTDAGVAWSGLPVHFAYALCPAISLVYPGEVEIRMVHPS